MTIILARQTPGRQFRHEIIKIMTVFSDFDPHPLRVTLDATPLRFPPSGIRTYVEALIDQFAHGEPGIELVSIESHSRFAGRLPHRFNRVAWDMLGAGRAARGGDLLHVAHGSVPLRCSVPVVVTLHDLIPLTDSRYRQSRGMRLYQSILTRTLPNASAVIVPSHFVAGEATRLLSLSTDQIHVVPMAAGPHFQLPGNQVEPPAMLRQLGITGRFIFNVGGFDSRKNLPLLLEAFDHFRHNVDQTFQLVIAGAPHTVNPHVYPPLEPHIHRLGLENHVLLPGFISEEQKVAFYQHAAMYVTPSLSEGFGMTVLEAMACGAPVVAANRTSLPEVAGDAGLLVEPDAQTFAGAMIAIATDPLLARSMRERGLKRARLFSWRATADQTASVYRRIGR